MWSKSCQTVLRKISVYKRLRSFCSKGHRWCTRLEAEGTSQGNPFIVMTPLGNPFRKFSIKSLRGIIETLREVHFRGFVHRDIRRTNLVVFEEDVYLIDWGFATKIGQSVFNGNLHYAANDILLAQTFPDVVYMPKHDLQMLVKTLFSIWVEDNEANIKKFDKPYQQRKQIADLWESLLSQHPTWTRMMQLCETVDYAGLINCFNTHFIFPM